MMAARPDRTKSSVPPGLSLVTNASVTPARVARTGAGDTGKFDESVLPVT